MLFNLHSIFCLQQLGKNSKVRKENLPKHCSLKGMGQVKASLLVVIWKSALAIPWHSRNLFFLKCLASLGGHNYNSFALKFSWELSQFMNLYEFLHCCQILIETINYEERVGEKILVPHNSFYLRGPYWIIAEMLWSSNYLWKSHKVTAEHGN